MATATDDNAEIRNLNARLFEKSTCWHTSYEDCYSQLKKTMHYKYSYNQNQSASCALEIKFTVEISENY